MVKQVILIAKSYHLGNHSNSLFYSLYTRQLHFFSLAYLCPFKVALPLVTSTSPVSILNVVVLPAPLTPSKPKHCPLGTPKQDLSTAIFLPFFP